MLPFLVAILIAIASSSFPGSVLANLTVGVKRMFMFAGVTLVMMA